MGIYALALSSSNCIGPIISGFINDSVGFTWVFYVPSILCGAGFVFLFFFMEETNYDRKTVGVLVSNAQNVTEKSEASDNEKAEGSRSSKAADVSAVAENEQPTAGESYPIKSFWQKLSLLDKPRPFMMLSMVWNQLQFVSWPVIFYAGWAYGCSVVWSIVLGATSSLILSAPPYNFT
jgi:MFS family permease